MFKLIPRLKPNYDFSDWLALINIFQKGPIKKYEKEFAQKFENQYGVMFQHGRTALYALFKIWNLKDAEIITPAYTCVVVPNAIVMSQNRPVFIDCAENSFNMDIEHIKKALTSKTRAIIVTHLFGYPMDVRQIETIVKEAEATYGHKIYIIQDVAHSYGAKRNHELVTKFGDASIFGSNISKVINSIFGGMVITNNKKHYEKLQQWKKENLKPSKLSKSLRRALYFIAVNIAFNDYIYSFVNWCERKHLLDKFVKYYEDDTITMPDDWQEEPCDIEARIGLNQLKKYDDIIQRRVFNAQQWIKKLEDADIIFMKEIDGSTYSHCVGLVKNREEWLERYRKKGLQLGILIEYSIPYMKAYEKYKKGDYPISLYYSKSSINFPNWYN